jgi:hypothetical protein
MNRQFLSFSFCAIATLGILGSDTEDPTPEEQVSDVLADADKLKDGKADDAVAFNDGIVGLQVQFMIPMQAYEDAEPGSAEESKHIEDAIKECRSAIKTLDKLEPYSGGASFKSAAQEYFEAYLDLMLLSQRSLTVTTAEEQAALELEAAPAVTRIQSAELSFDLAQRSFAMSNNMQLTETVEIPSEGGN